MAEDNNIAEMREAIKALHASVENVRDRAAQIPVSQSTILPADSGWNFTSFEKFINQRFTDFALQLRERYEAQQDSVTAALGAAEKAVTAALTAAEKAVDKAEGAQQLRNAAQNEFRQSLSDLSSLMWTSKEGIASLESLRREIDVRIKSTDEKLNSLNAAYSNLQGRFAMIGIIWGVIIAIVSAAIQYFRH